MFSTADARVYYSDPAMWNSVPVVILLILWSTYLIALGIYRVTLSPIANFPGPKLAAFTIWYQAYYDAWLQGRYFKKIDELHAEYGPIVRINPYELHVSDPNFIDKIYTGSSERRNKVKWVGEISLLPESTVATVSHELHRTRRAALNPYFSKASVRRLEPVIQETLQTLLSRFVACAKTGATMRINTVYQAASIDIITSYSFGVSVDYLKKDDYNVQYFEAAAAGYQMVWWITFTPWLGFLLTSFPESVVCFLMPGFKFLSQMQRQFTRQIKAIRESKDLAMHNETIFHGILNSDLPPSEKQPDRLRQEAQLLVSAGSDTVASTLSATTFHLLANPSKLRKLKEELAAAIPDPNTVPTSAQLERLPYLSAVIQEGLRLHPGTIARLQRVSPDTAIVYRDKSRKKEWTIPAGTEVSMDPRTINMNSTIFPEPRNFVPERWIDNPRLDRYLMTFSKGTRMCIGINLAYAELYIILGNIFRKYDIYDGTGKQEEPTLALYDTIRERDVDAARDLQAPFPEKGSKGIRITVREGKLS